MEDRIAQPPFRRIGPEAPVSPVIISVTHAGRCYSEALLKSSRLPKRLLEALEDPLVDRLVRPAAAAGTTAIVAEVPRAEIDLNRDEREIDPAMISPSPPPDTFVQSPRTRGGLGLVPSRLPAAGQIWRERLCATELARRVAVVHRPFHLALERLLQETRDRFGIAILLDCHSMPARDDSAGDAQVILGDRHGTSIAADLVEAASAAIAAAGYRAGRNAPYAGGYVTARHGRPDTGIHALQIEVDRSLYLARDLRSPGPGFDRIAAMIAAIAAALAAKAVEEPAALAAE